MFGDACLRACNGEAGIVECTYVQSSLFVDKVKRCRLKLSNPR